MNVRQLHEDSHRLIGTMMKDDATVYKIESIPQVENSLYGKMISQYVKNDSWEDCSLHSTDYYDKSGNLIKKATFTWQQIDDVWLLDKATFEIKTGKVEKNPDGSERIKKVFITYEITEAKVNTGLEDEFFTKRNLGRNLR
jgi:hypothetical protein